MTGDVTTRSALLDSLWRSVDSFFDDERSRTRAAFRWRSRATIAANGRWARRVVLNAPVRHRANSSLGRIIGQPGKDARWKEIDAKCYMNMRPLYQPQVTQTEAGARTMCEKFLTLPKPAVFLPPSIVTQLRNFGFPTSNAVPCETNTSI